MLNTSTPQPNPNMAGLHMKLLHEESTGAMIFSFLFIFLF